LETMGIVESFNTVIHVPSLSSTDQLREVLQVSLHMLFLNVHMSRSWHQIHYDPWIETVCQSTYNLAWEDMKLLTQTSVLYQTLQRQLILNTTELFLTSECEAAREL